MGEFNLDEALARFPLPEGVEDCIVNRTQLGRALNTSENSISKWLLKGLPCLTEGGNGREFEFQLSECYAWRRATQEAERAAKDRAEAAAAQLSLEFLNEDLTEGAAILSPREIREHAEADLKRNQAAAARGELVKRALVDRLFEDVLIAFRTQITTLVDFAEMEFGLSPDQSEIMQRRCDNALTTARLTLQDTLGAPAEVRDLGAARSARGGDAG